MHVGAGTASVLEYGCQARHTPSTGPFTDDEICLQGVELASNADEQPRQAPPRRRRPPGLVDDAYTDSEDMGSAEAAGDDVHYPGGVSDNARDGGGDGRGSQSARAEAAGGDARSAGGAGSAWHGVGGPSSGTGGGGGHARAGGDAGVWQARSGVRFGQTGAGRESARTQGAAPARGPGVRALNFDNGDGADGGGGLQAPAAPAEGGDVQDDQGLRVASRYLAARMADDDEEAAGDDAIPATP